MWQILRNEWNYRKKKLTIILAVLLGLSFFLALLGVKESGFPFSIVSFFQYWGVVLFAFSIVQSYTINAIFLEADKEGRDIWLTRLPVSRWQVFLSRHILFMVFQGIVLCSSLALAYFTKPSWFFPAINFNLFILFYGFYIHLGYQLGGRSYLRYFEWAPWILLLAVGLVFPQKTDQNLSWCLEAMK